MNRVVVLRTLPPDEYGNRRVRICYFVKDDAGPVKIPDARLAKPKDGGKHYPFKVPGCAGYIACQPKRANVMPVQKGGETYLCTRSDDPRAVTCPDCEATDEFKVAMAEIEERQAGAVAVS
jgi:hypothetical protein